MPSFDPKVLRFPVFMAALVFFLFVELAVPYRKPTVSKPKRWFINLSITAINSVILNLLFAGLVIKAALYVTENRLGVLNLTPLPHWAKTLATVAFMDFTLYVWHLLNHEMPFLWRLHRVHHSDLNMDVSTATRFHIGELLISAVIKISLIFFLGADLLGVVIFESALVLCAQFHHSSLKLPKWLETVLWTLFVPPSMHRIHHSVKILERNTNYGTIFSLWDRTLGTLKADVDQDGIRIGVGAYPREAGLNLHHLLIMPFYRQVK